MTEAPLIEARPWQIELSAMGGCFKKIIGAFNLIFSGCLLLVDERSISQVS